MEKSLIISELKAEKNQLFPSAMKAFNKQGYVQYEFKDHSPNNPVHRVQGFLNSFVRPKTPAGWTKVVEDWSSRPTDERQAAQPNRPEGAGGQPPRVTPR